MARPPAGQPVSESAAPAPARASKPGFVKGLARGFTALGVRNYRLFWTGQLISLTGTWMQTTAQAWLVLQLSGSPAALGFVAVCQFLPITLLSLFAGVVTDRFPKYRLLLVTQSASLLQAALFGVLVVTGTVQLWHIYLLTSAARRLSEKEEKEVMSGDFAANRSANAPERIELLQSEVAAAGK